MSRHARLRRALDELGCASAVLAGPVHTVHLAGYSRYLSSATAVVVSEDGSRTLVVPLYELAAAEAQSSADAVVAYGDADFLDLDLVSALVRTCRSLCSGRVGVAGIDSDHFDDAVHVGDLAASVRGVKDADELVQIERAVELSLRAQNQVAAGAAKHLSEIELFSLAHAFAQNEALEPVGFVGGVLCGPHTAGVAAPAAVPGPHRPLPGETVLVDIAIQRRGYWGDTTRTTIVGENPEASAAIAEIAGIATRIGESLRPGLRACDVFEQMREAILTCFPDGNFPHHGGHGIGIEVAEDPQLLPTVTSSLEAGMVLAVEPGVYFPGRFGVRVEDVYAVSNEGGMRLGSGVAVQG